MQGRGRTGVPKQVDWLGQPIRRASFPTELCLRQMLLPSAVVLKMKSGSSKRRTPTSGPPTFTFRQKSCLAYTTGAALTGAVTSGYAAKAVATPLCVVLPPPYSLGCTGAIVGAGAIVGLFVGGMTATQSPFCRGKFSWNRESVREISRLISRR